MKTHQLLVIRSAIALSLVWQVWHVNGNGNVDVTYASVASPASPSPSHNQVTQ